MHCPICGESLNVNQDACPKCGTPLDWSDYTEENEEVAAAGAAGTAANIDNNDNQPKEESSYYKDINRDDPFAPGAAFNNVEYPNATQNSNNFEEMDDFADDIADYSYMDDEEEDNNRRMILLILAALAVLLFIFIIYQILNNRPISRDVISNTTSSEVEESDNNLANFTSETTNGETSTTTTEEGMITILGPSNSFIYVTPEPTTEPTTSTTTETTTTEATTEVTTEVTTEPTTEVTSTTTVEPTTEATTAVQTTSTTVATTSTTVEPSTDAPTTSTVEVTEAPTTATTTTVEQTTVQQDNAEEETTTTAEATTTLATSTNFPTDQATYDDLNSANLPTETVRPTDDEGDVINPYPVEDTVAQELNSYLQENVQNIDSNTISGEQSFVSNVELPNFSHVSQVSSETWVSTYFYQYLEDELGETNPYEERIVYLSDIQTYLQENVNAEITLDPNASYAVSPYNYYTSTVLEDDTEVENAFVIFADVVAPEIDTTIEDDLVTRFIPYESIQLDNGQFEVRSLELNFVRETHEDFSFRFVYDRTGTILLGITTDSADAVASSVDQVQNDVQRVYFASVSEMINNISYVKYVLEPADGGGYSLVSKISYNPTQPNSELIEALNTVRVNVLDGLILDSVRTAEVNIPVYRLPNVGSIGEGTIQEGNTYLEFDPSGGGEFRIALTNTTDGGLIGYISLNETTAPTTEETTEDNTEDNSDETTEGTTEDTSGE